MKNAGLKIEPGSKLERAWAARSENAVRPLCRSQRSDLVRRCSLGGQNQVTHIHQVSDVEQVKDLPDQLQAITLAKVDRLGYTKVLRDQRITAELRSRRQLC